MKRKNKSHKNEGPIRRKFKQGIPIKSLRMILTFFVLFVMLITTVFTVFIYFLLGKMFPDMTRYTMATSAAAVLSSAIIGTVLAAIVSKWFLSPLQDMIYATEKVSKGDFKVKVKENYAPKTELGILQRSFNHMAQELDSIEMFRKDFINNFSHEFKTPMVSLRGFAHQLQAGGLTEEEEREYIAIIASEADRLTNMANNILMLSKLENQKIVTSKTRFDLDEQIRTCLVLLEKQWSRKNLELDLDLDTVSYCFNEAMLSEVWMNLFSNAIKFTPEYGKISCVLREQDKTVRVVISDTGKGMDAETLEHIFEKFYQGDKSHAGEGNGIGLTVVSRIMELCGGRITVESQPNMGSVFTVILPAMHEPDSV